MAGAKFGYSLLWGLMFSVIATVILQEMSARVGIITGQGLGEALRRHFTAPASRYITIVLVISAITIGNAAFETGNIIGTSLGLQTVFGNYDIPFALFVVISGTISFILLFLGSYKVIERVMISLVILMSMTFIATAVIVSPDLTSILKGLFIPSVPNGSIIMLVGLIGTTVVPYNLFLHSSAVQEKWKSRQDLPAARLDISVSVLVGGLISIAIVVTSAVAFFGSGSNIKDGADLGYQLEPLAGKWARYFIGTGLFAAGISSSITAPLAAGYATAGIMGWSRDIKSSRFRMTWGLILFTGIIFSLFGFKPLEAIIFAQAANGILLPVVAVYLLRVMNSRKVMGDNINTRTSNIAGFLIVLIALGLGIWSLMHVTGII
jgi:NRAMP (natural resistance-associated macrophage protein)-like metal ion transporter